MPAASPPSPPSLYEATDLAEGLRAINACLPKWGVPCALAGSLITYFAVFKVRVLLAKRRVRDRELDKGSSAAPSVFSGEEDCGNDASLLTYDEVEEFRRSLGLVLPRDQDLMNQIESMLIDDPIPEGWELYRCTYGVRFRNAVTGDLAFFHPGAHELELQIRQELASRDGDLVEAMATSGQYMFDQPLVDDDNNHQTTFMNVFNDFLKKERPEGDSPQHTPRATGVSRHVGSMRSSAAPSKSIRF